MAPPPPSVVYKVQSRSRERSHPPPLSLFFTTVLRRALNPMRRPLYAATQCFCARLCKRASSVGRSVGRALISRAERLSSIALFLDTVSKDARGACSRCCGFFCSTQPNRRDGACEARWEKFLCCSLRLSECTNSLATRASTRFYAMKLSEQCTYRSTNFDTSNLVLHYRNSVFSCFFHVTQFAKVEILPKTLAQFFRTGLLHKFFNKYKKISRK